jgi:DNA-binding NarL/FixJ family response regulator
MTIAVDKKKVFLVDDHPLVREWLTTLINQQPDLAVCGESENAASTLSGIATAAPDLVIVDINLKDSSGVELIKLLKRQYPDLFVLVLSMHDESLYAERAFRAGARGYVNKRENAHNVVEAVRHVLEGNVYTSPRAAELLAGRTVSGRTSSESPVGLLSDRELAVFDKLGEGIGTRQIAEEFQVSVKTIQEYCARIKEKMNLASATELLREAVRWHDAKNAG